MNMEQHRMQAAINHFCREARGCGLVINPKDVALEVSADKETVKSAAKTLESWGVIWKRDREEEAARARATA